METLTTHQNNCGRQDAKRDQAIDDQGVFQADGLDGEAGCIAKDEATDT